MQPVTARLIVRRVRDQARLDELFPVWRHHPFLTDSLEPAAVADVIHRRHAIIETTFADLIDGPLAHLPSGRFPPNAAWALCAAITHNLLRAAGTLAGPARPWPAARPCAARSSTCPPASPSPNAAPCCTCPNTGPGQSPGSPCGTASSDRPHHPSQPEPRPPAAPGPTRNLNSGNAGQTSGPGRPPSHTMINYRPKPPSPRPSTDRGLAWLVPRPAPE